jgi:hypothetical protein
MLDGIVTERGRTPFRSQKNRPEAVRPPSSARARREVGLTYLR